MTYYSYGYPRKKIWDLYQPHHSVIQYPAWSAGMKLRESKGCTWKIRNLQTFSKISREYCKETCVRVSLKEKQSVGEKHNESPCHRLSHFCLILSCVHCKAVFNKSSSSLCDTLKKSFPGGFLGQFLQIF